MSISSRRVVSLLFLVYNIICAPLLFLAPTLLFTHSKHLILQSCSNSTGPSLTQKSHSEALEHNTSCYNQRQALYQFAIFNVVRILSFKYEKLVYKISGYCDCAVRQYRPGLYLNSALAVPFLARQVCNTFFDSYGAHFFFVFAVACCSFLLLLPYVRDICFLISSVVKGVLNDYYGTKVHLTFSLIAVVVYAFLVLVNLGFIMCDMSPNWFSFGYPLQFPYLNFPVVLFLIHQFILQAHKQLPHIIYELRDEDLFAHVERAKCLNWADCHYATEIHLLLVRPSGCSHHERAEIGQRIKVVRSIDELEPWLADKFRNVVLASRINDITTVAYNHYS